MENIVNIVNFIRGCEPRNPGLDLVEPVRQQIALLTRLKLRGTFLVQYDAIVRDDIYSLLKPLDPVQFELGVWLEMNRPHVEAAGLVWRGRPGFDWDWHAHVGFSVGYTPRERERLIDVLFEKFRAAFGYLPRVVGSWMLDAHSLAYMYDRYGVVAACICKDQWGTDGYTIWGGYWNQAYYPSRLNLFCPAQTAERQIDVPVFRMLGSDPVSQYDLGLSLEGGASECQHVASLEPVYGSSGADPDWVNWFVRQNFRGGSLAFAYAQAGQENSFGWPAMAKGLTHQLELFARLRGEGLRVEPLGTTGEWYRRAFPLTPATAVTALEPFQDRADQSVWYDSIGYRVNLYNDAHGLRIRDLFLFDETRPERYLNAVCETEYLVYDNLPVIDGNRMSGAGVRSGGYIVRRDGGEWKRARAGSIEVREGDGLTVAADQCGEAVEIRLNEAGIQLIGRDLAVEWAYDVPRGRLAEMGESALTFEHEGWRYVLTIKGGHIEGRPGCVRLVSDGAMSIGFQRQ